MRTAAASASVVSDLLYGAVMTRAQQHPQVPEFAALQAALDAFTITTTCVRNSFPVRVGARASVNERGRGILQKRLYHPAVSVTLVLWVQTGCGGHLLHPASPEMLALELDDLAAKLSLLESDLERQLTPPPTMHVVACGATPTSCSHTLPALPAVPVPISLSRHPSILPQVAQEAVVAGKVIAMLAALSTGSSHCGGFESSPGAGPTLPPDGQSMVVRCSKDALVHEVAVLEDDLHAAWGSHSRRLSNQLDYAGAMKLIKMMWNKVCPGGEVVQLGQASHHSAGLEAYFQLRVTHATSSCPEQPEHHTDIPSTAATTSDRHRTADGDCSGDAACSSVNHCSTQAAARANDSLTDASDGGGPGGAQGVFASRLLSRVTSPESEFGGSEQPAEPGGATLILEGLPVGPRPLGIRGLPVDSSAELSLPVASWQLVSDVQRLRVEAHWLLRGYDPSRLGTEVTALARLGRGGGASAAGSAAGSGSAQATSTTHSQPKDDSESVSAARASTNSVSAWEPAKLAAPRVLAVAATLVKPAVSQSLSLLASAAAEAETVARARASPSTTTTSSCSALQHLIEVCFEDENGVDSEVSGGGPSHWHPLPGAAAQMLASSSPCAASHRQPLPLGPVGSLPGPRRPTASGKTSGTTRSQIHADSDSEEVSDDGSDVWEPA